RSPLHGVVERDESLGSVRANLRNGRKGLFEKDIVHAGIEQRVDINNLGRVGLVGQQNSVARKIGSGGQERELSLRAIVSIRKIGNVAGIDPVEQDIVVNLSEMQGTDLIEAVPLHESPDTAIGRVLGQNHLRKRDRSPT